MNQQSPPRYGVISPCTLFSRIKLSFTKSSIRVPCTEYSVGSNTDDTPPFSNSRRKGDKCYLAHPKEGIGASRHPAHILHTELLLRINLQSNLHFGSPQLPKKHNGPPHPVPPARSVTSLVSPCTRYSRHARTCMSSISSNIEVSQSAANLLHTSKTDPPN